MNKLILLFKFWHEKVVKIFNPNKQYIYNQILIYFNSCENSDTYTVLFPFLLLDALVLYTQI